MATPHTEAGGEPGADARSRIDRDTLFTAALILVRVVILVMFLVEIGRGNFGGPDVARFRTLAHLNGTPWRDYRVEYAPLELLLIKGLFGVGILSAATRLALLAFFGELATWAGVRAGWGARAGTWYLAIGLPVNILALQRIDVVTVAVSVWAFVLVRRPRPGAAGAVLGAAVLTKVWPLVLLPGLWIAGKARALGSFAVVAVAGIAGWFLWAGTGGPAQVLGFRGATGWEAGSTVGSLIWTIRGGDVRLEAGAARIGFAPGWAKLLLGLCLVAVLVRIWRRADREHTLVAGGPAVTAIAALLVLSPVFSTQYVLWLLPWAAIAALEEEHPTILLSAIALVGAATATVAMYLYGGSHDVVVKSASLIRAVLLAGLVIWGVARRSTPTPTGATARSPLRSG